MTKKTLRSYYPFLLGMLLFVSDFITKWAVAEKLPLVGSTSIVYPYGGIGVFKNFLGLEFSLVHATNKGAAWGIFSDYQHLLLIFRILLLTCVIYYVLAINKDKLNPYPLALIISGALGNILDFFIYGHVIDMFHLVLYGYNYPVFNVADSAICIGVAWLIFFSQPSSKEIINDK